jgi:adenylate kinase family enzyme
LAHPRIHITGASGAGVSTLGAALARRLGCWRLDTDDFYWKPTDPPYQEARETGERLDLIAAAMQRAAAGWALSGSLDGWGDPLIPRFQRVIFLEAPTAVRLARLAERERRRFGAAIDPGGALHRHHQDFIAYAAAYDTGVFTGALQGRYRARHEAWLARLACPVHRLDGSLPAEALADGAIAAMDSQRPSGACQLSPRG